MQKILDRTQESLARALASLTQRNYRQQRAYLTTIGSLMLIVVVLALLVALLAVVKQLDYRRTVASRNVTDIALLLHRQESFLRRAQFTLDYYFGAPEARSATDAVQQAIRQEGRVRGKVDRVDAAFDLLVGQATQRAWAPHAGEQLWRLYESAQATLVTQQAFRLHEQAMLIGLTDDYAAIMPALAPPTAQPSAGGALPDGASSQSAVIVALRETLQRELQAQTGRRVPGKGERVWLGPYRDPLHGMPVISVVSAYYAGDTPSALITTSIPLDELATHLAQSAGAGATLLTTIDHRLVVSSPRLDVLTARLLHDATAHSPEDADHYLRQGAVFHLSLMPAFGALICYVPWGALLASLSWQLGVLGCLTLLALSAIILIARYSGLRLLRNAFMETARALESETVKHILVSATPVGLCIVRQSDHAILSANALATEWLGVEPGRDDLPARVAAELTAHAPDRSSVTDLAKITTFVMPASPSRPQTPGGDGAVAVPQFLQITCASACYVGDDALFCAILDATVQQALEQQLRLAQQTSEAMLRARSNFFASMSHEIRTPLNALLGNLELFARTPGLEAHQQRLATLGVAADALRRIVNDILDFSKIDAGEMTLLDEPFRPLDDFENLAFSYAPMAAQPVVHFYANLSPTLDQMLRGDRTRIAQIVNNLLGNAFKFTASGKISLSAELRDDAQGQPVLHCRVSDSGVGMDQALAARVFNPFVQGETSTATCHGGTGLGLTICAKLCELMNGQITVDSVPRVGSAFSVAIPLARQAPHRAAPVVQAARRGTVLVVCQERESGEWLGEWLRHSGWADHRVTSINGALAWLRVNRAHALVVTGEYGLDAVHALRAARPVAAAWITPTGPHQPVSRGEGVIEASAFSHAAMLTAVDLAADLANEHAVDSARAAHCVESRPARAGTAPPLAALHGLTVLVAEDNPLMQTLIAEQLATLGCVPTIACDGHAALAALERARFDVLLTDIRMPAMDGHALLAAVRESHTGLPVLALSAVCEDQPGTARSERGFTGYVAKPASLSELEAALLEVVSAQPRGGLSIAAGRTLRSPTTPRTSRTLHAPRMSDMLDMEEPAPTPSATHASGAENLTRYVAILKAHFQTDLHHLTAIVDQEDRHALREWAHSASGALMVVQARALAERCCALKRLCDSSDVWTVAMDEQAMSLHEALCDHFGLDERPAP
jgi:two-component system capsular synthesis sensor histidine kinase RcsC